MIVYTDLTQLNLVVEGAPVEEPSEVVEVLHMVAEVVEVVVEQQALLTAGFWVK